MSAWTQRKGCREVAVNSVNRGMEWSWWLMSWWNSCELVDRNQEEQGCQESWEARTQRHSGTNFKGRSFLSFLIGWRCLQRANCNCTHFNIGVLWQQEVTSQASRDSDYAPVLWKYGNVSIRFRPITVIIMVITITTICSNNIKLGTHNVVEEEFYLFKSIESPIGSLQNKETWPDPLSTALKVESGHYWSTAS